MPSQSPQGKEASKPAPSLAAPKKRKVARLSVHPPALPCPTCGHCKRPGKRRLTQREDDARRVRTALQDFFHFRIQGARSQAVAKDGAESGAAPPVSRRRQGGRNPEPIRRLGDTLLTILLMDPDMEESVVARYLQMHSSKRTPERLNLAKARVEFNRTLDVRRDSADLRWWDKPAVRKNAFSEELREETRRFWESPAVSQPLGSQGTAVEKYSQKISAAKAHAAFLEHKRKNDGSFTCSLEWFNRQRPAGIRKFLYKPKRGKVSTRKRRNKSSQDAAESTR